jgi:hypothetical protein
LIDARVPPTAERPIPGDKYLVHPSSICFGSVFVFVVLNY